MYLCIYVRMYAHTYVHYKHSKWIPSLCVRASGQVCESQKGSGDITGSGDSLQFLPVLKVSPSL